MTKIDVFSGFLGAGKTTLIKKLIKESYAGEKLVLIENEFGEIGVDGGFLQDAGIKINELNSGCICCSLVGDFAKALKKVTAEYSPDRILIEPSGVGKLSDVLRAVESADLKDCVINSFTTVVDAVKCKMYLKNFGEFFSDQVATAGCIVFSHAENLSGEKLAAAVALVRSLNPSAPIVTTPFLQLDGGELLAAIEGSDTLQAELERLKKEHAEECDDEDEEEHEHHHGECCHHHDHDDDDDDEEEEHEGHEHHHGECCHHHDHDHDHDHEGHHHHHHHADEVFSSWGVETGKKFTREEIQNCLSQLTDAVRFGTVLRAKGIVAGDGVWYHFDYIPGNIDIREGAPAYTGRLCVIGAKIDGEELSELFKLP